MSDPIEKLGFDHPQPLGQLVGQISQEIGVQADASHLHIGQHPCQRHLDVSEKRQLVALSQFLLKNRSEPQADLGVGRRVRGRFCDRYLRHGDLFATGSDQFIDRRHLDPQPHPGQRFQAQIAGGGVGQPLSQHGVEAQWLGHQPVARQHGEVEFQVVAHLLDLGIGQRALKRLDHRPEFELLGPGPLGRVPDRNVVALTRLHCQRDPHQFG